MPPALSRKIIPLVTLTSLARGVYGMAFDAAGNLYVSYAPTGNIYKFKPGGGVADATTLLTTTALGPSLARLGLRQERQPVRQPRRDHRQLHHRSCIPDRSFQRHDPTYRCVRSYLSNRAFRRSSERRSVHRRFLLRRRIGQPRHVAHRRSRQRLTQDHGVYHSWREHPTPISHSRLRAQFTPGQSAAPPPGSRRLAAPTVPVTPTVSHPAQYSGGATWSAGQGHAGQRRRRIPVPQSIRCHDQAQVSASAPPTSPPIRRAPASLWRPAAAPAIWSPGLTDAFMPRQGDGVFKITDAKGACNYAASKPAAVAGAGASHRFAQPGAGHVPDLHRELPLRHRARWHAGLFPGDGRQSAIQDGPYRMLAARPLSAIRQCFRASTRSRRLPRSGTTELTSNQAVITWASGQHTSFLTLNLSPTTVMVGKPVTLVASLSDVSGNAARTGFGRQRQIHA